MYVFSEWVYHKISQLHLKWGTFLKLRRAKQLGILFLFSVAWQVYSGKINYSSRTYKGWKISAKLCLDLAIQRSLNFLAFLIYSNQQSSKEPLSSLSILTINWFLCRSVQCVTNWLILLKDPSSLPCKHYKGVANPQNW